MKVGRIFLLVSLLFLSLTFVSAFNFPDTPASTTNNIYIVNDTEIDHNELDNLQGGTADQYYHITLAWFNELTSDITNWITQAEGDALYSGIEWDYNQSLSTFTMWNSTWDNSFMNIWNYNQTIIAQNYADANMSVSVLQGILNSTGVYSTYNSTYDSKVTDNESWNESYSNSLYIAVGNQSIYDGLINNNSYLSTYNATYDGIVENDSYLNNETYNYNQTIPSNTYTDTVNNSQSSWITNTFLSIANALTQYFNKTDIQTQYYNKTDINSFNSSWSSTYNSTYDTWAYNQTIPANAYTDTQIASVNITSTNLTIGDKITFRLGGIIDNLVNGWIRVTGNLSVTESVNISGDLNVGGFVYSKQCPDDMAYISKVGGYCIDKYEASTPGCENVGDNCGNYTHADYCPTICVPDNGVLGGTNSDTGTTAVAYSKVNVAPFVGVSQKQARQMCANAGKRLCSDEEWLGAANLQGQVYYLPASLSASPYDCVVDSSEYCSYFISNRACNTSYNKNGISGCYSAEGVYDMVGNVWEWTDEIVSVITPSSGVGWYYANAESEWQSSTSGLWTKYGNDGTYFPAGSPSGRAVERGGYWNYGAGAGPFCASLGSAPSRVSSVIGFRCCSSS